MTYFKLKNIESIEKNHDNDSDFTSRNFFIIVEKRLAAVFYNKRKVSTWDSNRKFIELKKYGLRENSLVVGKQNVINTPSVNRD